MMQTLIFLTIWIPIDTCVEAVRSAVGDEAVKEAAG